MTIIDLDFENDDLDEFEEQLMSCLEGATPRQLNDFIDKAAAFLDDDDRYEGNVEPTHINNATSTICNAARLLRKAATAPQTPVVENIGNRGTNDTPFGAITFTDGVRVGYGRFDHVFQVFEMETFGAPPATKLHLKTAEAYIMNHYVEAHTTTA